MSTDAAVAAPTRVQRRRTTRHDRRRARLVALRGSIALVAGIVGIVAVLVWLAPLAGIHLVALATGSMTPTYPAGSVLLVRDVVAADVAVGDVVTVTRADGASVTHRVTSIAVDEGATALTLRGDANPVDDRAPYLAERVGLVVGGVPVGGDLLVGLRGPWIGIVLAVLVSLLVLWTWWPSRSDEEVP